MTSTPKSKSMYPTLEILAARSEVRNAPFTNICGMTGTNMEGLIGMRVARGFTQKARSRVGGVGGCHRISELVVEIAQAAYQIHFVRAFSKAAKETREREDDPAARHEMIIESIPGNARYVFLLRRGEHGTRSKPRVTSCDSEPRKCPRAKSSCKEDAKP